MDTVTVQKTAMRPVKLPSEISLAVHRFIKCVSRFVIPLFP